MSFPYHRFVLFSICIHRSVLFFGLFCFSCYILQNVFVFFYSSQEYMKREGTPELFQLNPVSRCISEDSSEASQPLKGHPYHLFVLFFISIYRYVLFLVCFMFLFSKKWETYFVMTFLKHKIYNV